MDLEQYGAMFRAEADHWWYKGQRRIADAFIDRVLAGRRDLRILDAGCGTGMNCRHLSSRGDVIGLDVSAEAMRFSRERRLTALARGGVENLPFASESFDLVTSFDVLYHIGVSNEAAGVGEMARVLRRGGYLLVRLPAYDWLRSAHDRAVHTRRRFTSRELRGLIKASGLEIVAAGYANSALFPVAAAARLAERVIKPKATTDPLSNPPPRSVNGALTAILGFEGRAAARFGLPFGLSVFALARKPIS